jgi:adenine-specific DNA-methyltransferase
MKSVKSQFGQFFTEEDLCKNVLEIVNTIKPIGGNILEPSFGDGEFIKCLSAYNYTSLDGIEIDKSHFNKCKVPNTFLYNMDFLEFSPSKKYDFIIGNPPYIELCYSFYNKDMQDLINQRYTGLSNGRINLVHIFMKESIDMLNDDGVIAYLLPSAILTSPIYKSIRKLIFNNFNVEYLDEDVKFKGVAIKVCLLIIKKTKNNNNYFYINGDNYFITTNYNAFSEHQTLKDVGFDVSIGEVVWNQKKEYLTDDPTDKVLIYSSNVGKNEIIIGSKRERKQYIKGHDIKYQNCIVVPRTIAKVIKYALVENNKNYIFENHTLVLHHSDLEMLRKVYQNLHNGRYDNILTSFFNSSNLSKGELLSLPFIV